MWQQVYAALGELETGFRMLITGSRAQASGNDAAAVDFLQPRHIDLDFLQRDLPKGSPQATAQVPTPDCWSLSLSATFNSDMAAQLFPM